MRRANVRGHTRGLPNSEIIDDLVSMRRRVERKVLDHHVVEAKQVDYLGGLGLVEGAALNFDCLFRPAVAHAQKFVEEVGFARRRNGERENKAERVWSRRRRHYDATSFVYVYSHLGDFSLVESHISECVLPPSRRFEFCPVC